MEWFNRNRDWILTLAVFSVLGLLGFVWSLFFRSDPSENQIEIAKESVVFTRPATQQNSLEQSEDQSAGNQSTAFFLEPGPTELLEKLEHLNYREFNEESAKLPGLKVMWPAYFFSIKKIDNGVADVLLDVSEDGFGALILTSIDTTKYSEILQLQPGKKIWIAGEITGVDPSGTGQFLISTEYVKFDDYQPPSASQPVEKQQGNTQ